MEEDFSTCLAFTLREEGGFVDNPEDPGGATNMGITLTTYRTWSDDPLASATVLRAMPERAAAAIQEADSGANHQAGVDGDDPSVADEAISGADSADSSRASERPAGTEVAGATDTDRQDRPERRERPRRRDPRHRREGIFQRVRWLTAAEHLVN